MIELGDELGAIDHPRELDAPGAVLQAEGDVHVWLQLPDHLQHQELVEVRVEQRAHDRIDPEGMVVGPGRRN